MSNASHVRFHVKRVLRPLVSVNKIILRMLRPQIIFVNNAINLAINVLDQQMQTALIVGLVSLDFKGSA
jgi:hypothetical protein